jgi:U2-associated protein SR140
MAIGKKRSFQDYAQGHRDRHGPVDRDGPTRLIPKPFDTSDDEDAAPSTDRAEEKATAKPTLRLLNLPLGTSPAVVKALIPSNLVVENVRMEPPPAPGGSDRRSMAAIITLAQDTPANEIDVAVSSLQNRYLGYGHYLSLHRHLSSAVSSSAALPKLVSSGIESHPFGAKPVEAPSDKANRQTQQGFNKGFAPPPSYNQQLGGVSRASLLAVPVKPPNDVRLLQLISKTIERVLEHGPEFEALLMSRPEVQREEKWAWIWDARSEGGIWYRWKLWEVVTGGQQGSSKSKYVPLFDGGHAWKCPEKPLSFEYTTHLEEFVSDSEYNSSDDEDLEGEGNRDVPGDESEKTFLNPLEKAKLTHLLARLATTLTKLRKGDIARVTTFAIMHASRGVEEVVDMIVSNVEKPFSLTRANPDWKTENKEHGSTGGVQEEPSMSEGVDTSSASLVGLYVVNDILSSSSTSGVRHAWRFRQLFEVALRDRKVFERLGMMAEKLGWGRLRAEKWKRSVNLILNLWEGWCVFPVESQELFAQTFENPPSLRVEEKVEDAAKKGKWKSVEASQAEALDKSLMLSTSADAEEDVEGEPIGEDDVVGEPVDEEDVEGEPIEEEDVEGEPIRDDDIEGEPIDEDDVGGEPLGADEVMDYQPTEASRQSHRGEEEEGTETNFQDGEKQPEEQFGNKGNSRMRRMRAVDMFADSDGSDSN